MLDKSQIDVSHVNFWQDIYQTFKKISSVGDILTIYNDFRQKSYG